MQWVMKGWVCHVEVGWVMLWWVGNGGVCHAGVGWVI